MTPATAFADYKQFMETEVQPKRTADPFLTSIVLFVDSSVRTWGEDISLPVFCFSSGDGAATCDASGKAEIEAELVVAAGRMGNGPLKTEPVSIKLEPGPARLLRWHGGRKDVGVKFFRSAGVGNFLGKGFHHLTLKNFNGWRLFGANSRKGEYGDMDFPAWREGIVDVWLGEPGLDDLDSAFRVAPNLLHVGVTDTSKVTDMAMMFCNSRFVRPLDCAVWDTSKVVSMHGMFCGAQMANPATTWWDVSSVDDMSLMFAFAIAAEPQTIWWDVRNVSDMECMFKHLRVEPETRYWYSKKLVGKRQYVRHEEWKKRPDFVLNSETTIQKLPDRGAKPQPPPRFLEN